MGRHRKPGRPRGSAKKNKDPYQAGWEKTIKPDLNPEAIREISGIILIAFSIIILLGIFKLAGSLPNDIYQFLKVIIGFGAFVAPVVFIFLGVALFYPEKYQFSSSTIIGIGLFFLSLSGIFHIFVDPSKAQEIALKGSGGGYLGYIVQINILKILNVPGSLIFLVALFLISILLVTNTPLRKIIEGVKEYMAERKKEEDVQINEPINFNSKGPSSQTNNIKKSEEDFKILTVGQDTGWEFPPLNLLDSTTTKADSGNIKYNAAIIKKTLEDFGIKVMMSDVNIGPTVAQYTLKPPQGIKLNKITTLDRDLALALAAHPIRIEAPIPGKSLVGIEIPNKTRALVRLLNILESKEFADKKSNLRICLGLDVSGQSQVTDLEKMPHLLIAGSTGSGKSVCINSILLSLLYQNSPSQLKLILVDPKRVELSHYDNIPHLLSPVVIEPEKTVSALKWTVSEMERRYRLFQEAKKRNIYEYNDQMGDKGLSYIVIIIDELADIMAVSASEVEALICRLAQMARATGIHLILATQRPSVDVITGLIKANVTTRIAFSVASQVDSRTILDQAGAEKLLGNGDMLYISSEISKPKRIQGVFISEKELKNVTNFLKKEGIPEYNEEVLTQPVKTTTGFDIPEDDLFEEACEIVVRSKKASASLLQRRLRIGYARAARLLDLLEERGVVSPPNGSRPREILIQDPNEILDKDDQ